MIYFQFFLAHIKYEPIAVFSKGLVSRICFIFLDFRKINISTEWRSNSNNRMAVGNFMFEIKDKRSKWKKLKLFTTTAPNSKVRPQTTLPCTNSSM